MRPRGEQGHSLWWARRPGFCLLFPSPCRSCGSGSAKEVLGSHHTNSPIHVHTSLCSTTQSQKLPEAWRGEVLALAWWGKASGARQWDSQDAYLPPLSFFLGFYSHI